MSDSSHVSRRNRRYIEPGLVWPDDRGRHIQAHGGAVIRHGEAWWWFGEDRSPDNDLARRYVACCTSTDLVNRTFRGEMMRLDVQTGGVFCP